MNPDADGQAEVHALAEQEERHQAQASIDEPTMAIPVTELLDDDED